MAKVKITGHASGTGILTVTAPNTSTDRTITLPDATGTLLNSDGSAASLTAIPAANLTGTVADARISALTASKLTGALPAISGASLTGISSFNQNIVKNGGFDVWQRGTSFTYTSGKNFIADRWWVTPNSGAHTQTRQAAGLDGFNYCLRMQRDASQTAVGVVYLNNEFESRDSMQFRGKKLTLSFYARKGANFSQASSYVTSNLVTGTGTDQTLVSGYTGGTNFLSQNNTLTTSWQRFTHTTGSVLATTVNQIAIQFTTAHEGTAGAADYYEITGVQLEEGDSATDFVHRPYGEELALCQRYYEFSDDNAGVVFHRYNESSHRFNQVFRVSKRAAPTMTTNSTGYDVYAAGAGFNHTATSIGNITADSFRITFTSNNTNLSGYINNFDWTSDAEL